MRCENLVWRDRQGWTGHGDVAATADLAVVFGARASFESGAFLADLKTRCPHAIVIGCSTSGQIIDADISDSDACAIAMKFESTPLASAHAKVEDIGRSYEAGAQIGARLAKADLRALFVLSDGLRVNGGELVKGIASVVGDKVSITGGLAGDGEDFKRTLIHQDGQTEEGLVAAIGFYGDSICVGHGSSAGWTPFGPKRMITRSQDNILFELDHQPALQLYKTYLGDDAAGLPGSAFLYPLEVYNPARPDSGIIRTITAVNEEAGSLIFAADIPQGWTAQLMRGYYDRLSAAANAAAEAAMAPMAQLGGDKAAILVSCVGRKIMMGESIIEEVLAARRALAGVGVCAGFYSYGEISPHAVGGACELHNQTMTITAFAES